VVNLLDMDLRHYRKIYKGITLKELATIVGCSISALSLIERGMRSPTYDLTQRITEATKGKVRAADLHNGKAA
jgi:transcriptional regulator with XRE-family HTH domain